MAVADIIEKSIGSFGRWQLLVFLLVFLVNGPLAMQELAITMIAPPVEFVCSDPAYNACSPECPSHVFNKSVFTNTVIMEWDLVCEYQWLENISQTILMAGVLVGNFFFGLFADRYGRRIPLVVGVVMESATGIGIAFCYHFWGFCVLRFLVSVAAGGTLCTGFVLVVEIIGRKYRAMFGILFQMTYYLGHASLGLIGYYIRNWRYIQLTLSLPVVLLICYIWLVPESPRWLLSVGRLEDAIKVMERAAKVNKMPTENIRENVMSRLENANPRDSTIIDLFTHRNIRFKTICIWINWVVLGLSFFGVAQYMGKIAGNLFVNMAASGLIQIPGNILLIYTIQAWGRKISIILSYLLCALPLLIYTLIPSDPEWPNTVMMCIAMMGISLAFATAFVWSGELFATPVRNVGVGSSATLAKFGSMAAPLVVYSKKYYTWLPPVIYGIGPLIAILASIFLPETLNTKMPDSVEEAEEFGKKGVPLPR